MSSILNFLANKEVLILLSVLTFILLIWIALFIQEKYSHLKEKMKLKQNTQELKELVEQVRLEEEKDQPNIEKEEVHPQEETSIASNFKEKDPASLEELIESITPEQGDEKIEENFVTSQPKTDVVQPTVLTTQDSKEEVLEIQQEKEKIEIIGLEEEMIPSPSLESTKKNLEEKIEYKEEVYTKTEAQQELERLQKELEKEEDNKIELTEFEAKQEENAIISLEELFAKGKSLVLENEETQYEDEGNEPISIQDLEKRVKEQIVEASVSETIEKEEHSKMQMTDFYTVATKAKPIEEAYQGNKKYTPSPVISPVFGLRASEVKMHDESLQLENTANFEKLDEEIRKTNEFLAILKELQKKLD